MNSPQEKMPPELKAQFERDPFYQGVPEEVWQALGILKRKTTERLLKLSPKEIWEERDRETQIGTLAFNAYSQIAEFQTYSFFQPAMEINGAHTLTITGVLERRSGDYCLREKQFDRIVTFILPTLAHYPSTGTLVQVSAQIRSVMNNEPYSKDLFIALLNPQIIRVGIPQG